MLKEKRGISLIVLIITIIVVIILASIIVMSFSNNNPIEKANEAKFKSDISGFRDELMATHSDSSVLDPDYVREDINVDAGSFGLMRKYIPDITESYANKVFIKKGNLLYVDDTSSEYREEEEKWAKEVGIQSPYGNVGDADGDGQITNEDVLKVQNYKSSDALSARQFKAYDANGDKVIDISDVSSIQGYIEGKINSLPDTGNNP